MFIGTFCRNLDEVQASTLTQNDTGPVGPVEVFFYWPEAVLGNFYWPGAIGSPLASSPEGFFIGTFCRNFDEGNVDENPT